MPITVVNNTANLVRCECTLHHFNIPANSSMPVDWAYAYALEAPNVSIWFGGMAANSKLCYNGNTLTWDGTKSTLA